MIRVLSRKPGCRIRSGMAAEVLFTGLQKLLELIKREKEMKIKGHVMREHHPTHWPWALRKGLPQ
jgi:hypothetical protein